MVMNIYRRLVDFAQEQNELTVDVRDRIDRMCLYRTFMSIEIENLHEDGTNKEKIKNVSRFLNNQTVKATAKRIGYIDGLRLFGKKYICLRMGFAVPLLKYIKGR